MRIAILQFTPQRGNVEDNQDDADDFISKAVLKNFEVLALPELSFTGSKFDSLDDIAPFLEPTSAGPTSMWARTTAAKHKCVVIVGYPEIYYNPPTPPEYFNSVMAVDATGEIAHYRKSPLSFGGGLIIEDENHILHKEIPGLGKVIIGDLAWPCNSIANIHLAFQDFASNVLLHKETNLIILPIAWSTFEEICSHCQPPDKIDVTTLSHWMKRLEPIIRADREGEIICAFANRSGTKSGLVYTGTSTVLGIKGGRVNVYGILGHGEEKLLVVDTEHPSTTLHQDHSTIPFWFAHRNSPYPFFVSNDLQLEEVGDLKSSITEGRSNSAILQSSSPRLGDTSVIEQLGDRGEAPESSIAVRREHIISPTPSTQNPTAGSHV